MDADKQETRSAAAGRSGRAGGRGVPDACRRHPHPDPLVVDRREMSVNDLAETIGKPGPSVSQHLAKLRMARLVRTRREGTTIFYQLENDHVRQLIIDARPQRRARRPGRPRPPSRAHVDRWRHRQRPPTAGSAVMSHRHIRTPHDRGPAIHENPQTGHPAAHQHHHPAGTERGCAVDLPAAQPRPRRLGGLHPGGQRAGHPSGEDQPGRARRDGAVAAGRRRRQRVGGAARRYRAQLLRRADRRFRSGSRSRCPGGRRPAATPTASVAPRIWPGCSSSLMIALSAIVAGWEAIRRLIEPAPIEHLGWVAAAGVIGFAGNELVALYRIRVGKQDRFGGAGRRRTARPHRRTHLAGGGARRRRSRSRLAGRRPDRSAWSSPRRSCWCLRIRGPRRVPAADGWR